MCVDLCLSCYLMMCCCVFEFVCVFVDEMLLDWCMIVVV